MERYLKYRKGRQMTDPVTYCKIATAIAETINIQKKLEPLYVNLETNLIEGI